MSVSHKYRTFDQLLEDVSVDFSTQALEGMIEPQQLIKVATRVNYDLGLRINRTRETVIDIEHSKGQLPSDFNSLNYAFCCNNYTVSNTMPAGTTVDTTYTKYVPDPGDPKQCITPTDCKDVCVVQTCPTGEYDPKTRDPIYGENIIVQFVGAGQYRTYSDYSPLRISNDNKITCDCPNMGVQSIHIAEIRDNFLLTNFTKGNVYISYQGAMEDDDGNLLVLDHPYCNEYYEYALKERILENMIFSGENMSSQLQFITGKLRAARNNALGFVNTPDFEEMRKIWEVNRKAQYHNYYNMFKSHPTLGG
jgi:hypothetical protein|tara:strand:+ start:2771 stop:3691 length:921 start_codon:yes stop_codon:yes gene_type:complete